MTNNKNNETFDKPLKGILKLKYKIVVRTGLHIGGSKESIEIGGIDNIVIKIPVYKVEGKEYRNVPYIPGSSLKGKIRALLEWVEKPVEENHKPIAIAKNGEPCNCGKCNVCKLFGAHKAKNPTQPIRLRIDDFYPTQDTLDMWENILEGVYTELKSENTIDRIKGTASNPRHTERVIPNSEFRGYITVKIFEGDTYENTVAILEKGIKMLEDDYLGGNGSRGYGRVGLFPVEIEWKSIENYQPEKISFEKIKEKVFGEK
ncbi:CRISPR-associated protein Csm3 [Persephonella hydrogeniphila]|uniref:CRISPR system Cms endoribonuclease Csm3 n=1 Tax=Persephonella hydrogeniphila TaxID=198703 RepID=A0A285NMD7_9AQUI|nr:type III-A CRISPR-associated RAMP protein Csm3 [Persephonella hydrogeniphila]SNZ10625.1 CRISPR-associated protein Csm3 [Persephonella hydrogeniphila]